MLPSTGYFKGINCPFYDSGLCERPYCHFRHVKKESFGSVNDGIENGDILQKLVSKVVQKVLQQSESSDASSLANSITDATKDQLQNAGVITATKATYNPTPICKLNKINNSDTENNDELNEQRKRHIPVPYTPRKPTSIPIKRPVDSDDFKPFIYNPPPVKYTPGSADTAQLDPYTPKGAVESKEKYLPGTEAEIQEYAPKETQTNNKRSYIPSDKSINKKKLLEYKPAKITQKSEVPSVTYQPTPCSLVPCFSSDEEEPQLKKPRLSNDLNGLDELGAEFDILDQIFDEEKLETDIVKGKLKSISHDVTKANTPSNLEAAAEKKKSSSEKVKSSKEKELSEKRDKSSDSKHEKSKSSHKKSDHKSSSSNEKDKEKRREKEKHVRDIKETVKDRDKEKNKGKDKHKDKEKHKEKDKSKIKEKDKSSDKKISSSKSSHRSSKHSDSSSKHSSRSDKPSKHKEKHIHEKHKTSKEKDRHSKKSKEKESNGLFTSENECDNGDNHEQDFGNSDEDICEISDSDEESIALECKRIFEEYVPTEKPTPVEVISKIEENNENEYLTGKKRVSRAVDKNIKHVPKAPVKPDYKVGAAQAMAERLAKVREYHAIKKAESQKSEETTIETSKILPSTPTGATKIRIAHVPYASTLMNAKRTISTIPRPASIKSDLSTNSTITQTVKKGEKRVAHVPNDKFIDRPGVLEPLASKIPANIRSTYLNMMIDECLKIYILAPDAYSRAQHEELNTSKKCSTVQIYKNSAVLTVSRLRKELQECKGVKKSGADCSMLQRTQSASGSLGNANSWSIETKSRKSYENIQEYRGAKFYNNIQKWILTEEQLQENGFPRSHTNGEKGKAMIYTRKKQTPPIGNLRTCCRCRKEYTVTKRGFATVVEECIYHPNNKYRVRGEVKYQCCSQDASSDGCCVAPTHVYEYVDYDNLKGYVKTMPPERQMDDYGVYSLDCEMCYTTHGLDLTRITVINTDCKVVYETLIKPLHPIIDYNTRYSGITEEHMKDVKTTLLDVQATLLTMFNSKTILIGHSLESDFKALKLIHDTVIDTSVLFPHKMGLPYKRALRNLCSEHLKKIIQNSVDGHDSAEDATVCMELLHYKLKEHLKTR